MNVYFEHFGGTLSGTDAAHPPGACSACPLAAAVVCRALDRASLAGPRIPLLRRIPRETQLVTKDRLPPFAGVLRQGFLRIERMTEDGRRHIVGLHVPGDLVGNWTGTSSHYDIEAATTAEICSFDPRVVVRLVERDSAVKIYILQELAEMHQRQLDLLWPRGALTSKGRIIAFLLMAMEIMPSEWSPDGAALVRIVISRRDWADISLTTVETICRSLAELSRNGLVQQVEPGLYKISNIEALKREAGIAGEALWKPLPRSSAAALRRAFSSSGTSPKVRTLKQQIGSPSEKNTSRADRNVF
ncbi:Crp/Fnr family transcriptional regulator [Paracoccus benzoatiresistens]|uniref:Crp/Fnr family transcriptional regulator n=1 Tax=Paracoccus benzoatiresistens TaxID=2997341 RepID=A0ABT4JBN0_9RHOB|nr:Crp/Fnr family transcriptional regulator [Paracoccus sp. EF6]MCZ0964536.1 Crp/Fnr family transcriptional regulator [Paracoccus sp. EF6]